MIWENVGIYELRPDKSARLLCKAGDSARSNLNYFDGQLYFTEYNKIYRLDPTTGQLTLLYEIEDSIRTLVVVDGIAYWLETNYNGYSAINKSGLDDFANMTLCKGLNAANISYWNGMLYVLVIDYSDDIYTCLLYTSPASEPEGDALSQYIYGLASRDMDISELSGLDEETVGYIRNGIYALAGKIFKTKEYQEYFSAQSWYIPYLSLIHI